MKFKPTKWKIVGVLLALIIDFLFWMIYILGFVDCTGKGICIGDDLATVFYITFRYPFTWIFLILVYVIWSLFEK
jgi:hypothetical protein